MKRSSAQALRYLFAALACAVAAGLLTWEAIEFSPPDGVGPSREKKELVMAGLASAPVAVPVLLHLQALLSSR